MFICLQHHNAEADCTGDDSTGPDITALMLIPLVRISLVLIAPVLIVLCACIAKKLAPVEKK